MCVCVWCHYTAALQSVFPQTELGTFMALTKIDKEKQLKELTNIVCGIRLFNRDCGKGGEGIDDCEIVFFSCVDYNSVIAHGIVGLSLLLMHVLQCPQS